MPPPVTGSEPQRTWIKVRLPSNRQHISAKDMHMHARWRPPLWSYPACRPWKCLHCPIAMSTPRGRSRQYPPRRERDTVREALIGSRCRPPLPASLPTSTRRGRMRPLAAVGAAPSPPSRSSSIRHMRRGRRRPTPRFSAPHPTQVRSQPWARPPTMWGDGVAPRYWRREGAVTPSGAATRRHRAPAWARAAQWAACRGGGRTSLRPRLATLSRPPAAKPTPSWAWGREEADPEGRLPPRSSRRAGRSRSGEEDPSQPLCPLKAALRRRSLANAL